MLADLVAPSFGSRPAGRSVDGQFDYQGCRVTVSSDGELVVESAR